MRRQRAALVGLLLAAGAAAASATCAAASPGDDPAVALALPSLGFEIFLATVALAGAALSREPLAARLGLGPGALRGGELGLLVLGTLALSFGLDGLLHWSGLRQQSALPQIDRALAGVRGGGLVLALLALGLAPGVAEELLCRGLVQRGLARRLGRCAAVLLAALLFGALHLDPIHAAVATLLGVYLGAAAALSGSTRASIACHGVNNLAAVALAAAGVGPEPLGHGGTLAALAAALLCAGAVLPRRAAPPG